MSFQNLEEVLQAAGNPVELLRNSQIGPYAFPVVRSRVHELARRAAVVAGDLRAVRPVASHDGPLRRGSRRAQAALRSRRQQLQELQGQSGQAVRRVQPRRLRHRRRDPLLSRREPVQPRRPAAGRTTGCSTTLETGELQREGRARRAIRGQSGPTEDLPVPGAGTERAEGHGEGHRASRRPTSGSSTWASFTHRRPRRPRAAPRHGRPAGMGDVRPVGRRRRGARRHRRGRAASSASGRSARERIRPAASSRDGFPRRCRRSTPATR